MDNRIVSATDAIPPPVKPRDSGAERFFQWSLYLLLVSGFAVLMTTNKLDLPSLLLVVPALLLRGYALATRRSMTLPERWTTYLTIAYFAFYAADYFYLSQSFIYSTVHLVLFILVVKIFSVHRERDLLYLAVIPFLLVLAAAVLTVDTTYLATFAIFILAAMATFISLEMRRSLRETQAAPVPAWQEKRFHRSLASMATTLAAFTLAGSAVVFFLLPRLNTVGYLRNLGVQGGLATGFSGDVRLGGIGQIQQSSAVVMHVQILFGKLPEDPKWRGIAFANFDGQRWWNPSEPPEFHPLGQAPLDLAPTARRTFYSPAAGPPRLPTLGYRVLMEPVGLNVFFLAPVPLQLKGDYPIVQTGSDGSVLNVPGRVAAGVREGPSSIGIYAAEADARDPASFVRGSTSRDYPPGLAERYLQLPRVDSRIADLARRVAGQAESNYDRARAIESFLKTSYGYTLELPGDTPDPLAYFLFERKKGHCEYFASSMTVMLRTLRIPARVVNGFRGGEYNDVTGSYIVRERDAHSWVEAYFPEFGWVTFDPTPAGPAVTSAAGWARVGLYLDAASEMWREWIINYDFSHQVRLSNEITNTTYTVQSSFRVWMWREYRRLVKRMGVAQRRMQRMSTGEMASACILLALLLALPFVPKTWGTLRQARLRRNPLRAPKSAASFWYLRLLKRLSRRGIRKTPAQTPVEFASSIADPRIREDVVVFTRHYERARFAASIEDAQRLPELYEEMAGKK
jgi:transglutaminase-like putative cysteine protease